MNCGKVMYRSSGTVMLLAMVSWLIMEGCSTSKNVERSGASPGHASTLSLSEFNKEIQGKTVTLTLKNGQQYESQKVTVSHDSTQFTVMRSLDSMVVTNDSIQEFEEIDHVGGGIDAAFVTPIAAVPVIFLAGAITNLGAEGESSDVAWLVPVCVAVEAAGIVLGASIGHRNFYRFSAEQTVDRDGRQGTLGLKRQ